MKEIVKRYGWPGPELVGADGAHAAFLLVQHSPDLAFQQAMLPLVRRSYESGKLSLNYALLQTACLCLKASHSCTGWRLNPDRKEPGFYPMRTRSTWISDARKLTATVTRLPEL
jgi:hypothetical protein